MSSLSLLFLSREKREREKREERKINQSETNDMRDTRHWSQLTNSIQDRYDISALESNDDDDGVDFEQNKKIFKMKISANRCPQGHAVSFWSMTAKKQRQMK